MERKAKIKKELPGDPANLYQQPADAKKSQPETITLQTLQASETRYRRLFETAQDGILILDAETGEIVDVNPYMIDMLHYSYEEFMGMRLWEVSPFKDTVLNRTAFEELQEKGYIQYKDLPLETKDGKPIAVEFVSNVYKSNGNKVIQCNIRNITERKEANRKLQEAAIFQQRLIDALPVPVFYKNPEGRYLGCNSAFEQLFGRQKEQIIGQSVHELSPVEFADIYHEKDLALLRNPGIQMYESTVRDTDGVAHNVIFHKATYLNMDGSVGGLIGGILDITDRKRAEESLKESEELFRSYVEYAPDGVYMSDLKGNFIYGNRKCEEIIGYRSDELFGKNLLELNILSKKDLNKAAELLQANVEGKSTGPDEIELISKEGRLVPVEINTSVVQRMGQAIVLAFVRDITERKRSEENLRKAEETYRLVVDNMADVITVMDLNLRFIYVSPSIIRMRGYKAEEVMVQPLEQVMTPESLQLVARVFEEEMKLEAGGTADPDRSRILELEQYKKDGSTVWLENHLSSFRDQEKKLAGVISVSRDITDRKRTEEELKRTLESLRKSVNATIQVMVSTVETRDPYTAGHQIRSANLARAIAAGMGLPQEKIDGIRMAGSIHDIGKLSIPAEILSKPTRLSEIEFSLIKEHARQGYEILKNVESPWPLAEIVHQHHERMDGSGYPKNLKGDDILVEARILTVADVVESMASHRPYRPALGIEAALQEIEKNRGKLYDAAAVDACVRLFREEGFQLEAA